MNLGERLAEDDLVAFGDEVTERERVVGGVTRREAYGVGTLAS